MTDKQIIIDYKNICGHYSPKVGCTGTFDGSCIKEQCFTYKLLQKLQTKDQECERLKEILTEIKEIVFPKNQLIITDSPIILKIQQKISEVEDDR